MIECIHSQLNATLTMMENIVMLFPEEKWKEGVAEFQVPWKLAYHTIECLHFYFSPGVNWNWGGKFNGGWWELKEKDAPSKSQMIDYLKEVKEHIDCQFDIDKNRELHEIYDNQREGALTLIEQYVYAIRHTMHHHGSLTTLAIMSGVEKVKWL